MGAAYNILGRAVLPHQLALATFGSVLLFVLPNPFAAKPVVEVPIVAGSKEEESYIKKYISEHASDKK